MMIRGLYRCLVWLHPPAFRLRFEEEMFWVFDQAVGTWGAAALVADAIISLSRQWLLRSGLWKWAAAASLELCCSSLHSEVSCPGTGR